MSFTFPNSPTTYQEVHTFKKHYIYQHFALDDKTVNRYYLCYKITPKQISFVEIEPYDMNNQNIRFDIADYGDEDYLEENLHIMKRVKKECDTNGSIHYEIANIWSSPYFNTRKKIQLNALATCPQFMNEYWEMEKTANGRVAKIQYEKIIDSYDSVYHYINRTTKNIKHHITLPFESE